MKKPFRKLLLPVTATVVCGNSPLLVDGEHLEMSGWKKSLNLIGHTNDARGIRLLKSTLDGLVSFHTGLLTDKLRSNAKIINSRENTIDTFFAHDQAIAISTVPA